MRMAKNKTPDRSISVVPKVRQEFLRQQALQVSSLRGEAAEVGVYKGGTAKIMAKAMPGRTVNLFDTFEGMPETSKFDVPKRGKGHQPGDFSDTSLEAVNEYLQGYNVHFWPGVFPDSARLLPDDTEFVLVHVDVDIYESTKAVCEFFWPRLVDGGIMVFDDYNAPRCPGTNKAVNKFFDGVAEIETSGRNNRYGTRVVKAGVKNAEHS